MGNNVCMQASQDDPRHTIAALMAASRAFVGITARSIIAVNDDVTLPQFRALVVLATRGPQRAVDISAELGVTPSTGTRMCDRLVRKGLVRRSRTSSDRRIVRLRLTKDGQSLVDEVVARRRSELAAIVKSTAGHWTPAVTAALNAFAEATGEAAEQEWWLGFAHEVAVPD
jgi:DNA-binding MarR family transcriptional regulator